MTQFMGNLFFRGVNTESINRMSYFEMREWNKWHDLMNKQEKRAMEKAINGGK